MQAQIPLSMSYKLNDTQTVGASFVVAYQLFEAWGLQAFEQLNLGATTSDLTNRGTDTSYGAGLRLGWAGDFMGGDMRVGVNYSSRVYMTEFENYKNLFAEQGDFDIPSNWAVGIAFQADKKTSLKVDFHRINYSEIASVGNPGPWAYDNVEFNPLCPGIDTPDCKLGGDNGMGFGWIDQNIIKLGIEHLYKPNLILRAGINHGSGVIPNDQVLFNLLAPATVEDHVTLGATYIFSPDIELSASYVHGFEKTVTGPTLFQPLGSDPAVTVNNASITMKQRALGFALGIKW
jgi:long-chain fatty acid transport protein